MSDLAELSRFRFDRPPLYPHQLEDLPFLEDTPRAGLFWEQGLAKSRELVEHVNRVRSLKTILLFVPAQCRSVWESLDVEDPSELMKYSDRSWSLLPYNEPASRRKTDGQDVTWITCGIELLSLGTTARRPGRHLKAMLDVARQCRPDLIAIDESWMVRTPRTARTIAATQIMAKARRRLLLNGTPTAQGQEMDLFTQLYMLDPAILGYKNFYQFRARHGIMGGYEDRNVVGIRDAEVIHRRSAPYVRRRLKKDHLKDLPPKIELPPREVPLAPATWKLYREMRDDMVTWLDANPSLAKNGGVKIMRLAQLTSGFLGGIVDELGNPLEGPPREVGREKTSALLEHLDDRRAAGKGMHIVWCRFQPEIQRLALMAEARGWDVFQIHGKATERQRRDAKRVFQYGHDRPALLVAHPASAGVGLTLVACHEVHRLSRDYSYLYAAQGDDRTHRGGQRFPVTYQDVLATGPGGQRTVDHQLRKIVARAEGAASLTSAAWIKLLTEE